MEGLQKQLSDLLKIIQELSENGLTVEGQLSDLQKLVPKIKGFNSAKYQKLFEENNQNGVKILGWDWIKTNVKVVEVAKEFNLDVESPVIKAFLTTIIVKLFQNEQ